MGPSETTILVFRVNSDGERNIGKAKPSEIFYCECTQRVHVEDEEIHKELIC